MKRFKIEQSDADIISHAGLALIGQAINRYTDLSREIDAQVPLRHGIPHSAVVKSYLAMLCLGKNDFEAINGIESEDFFRNAMGIETRPSEATLRQRLDKHSECFLPVVAKANQDFLTALLHVTTRRPGMTHVNSRVRKHRDALRRAGLRLVQIWVPDTRRPNFAAECRRQSRLVAKADPADTEMQHVMDKALADVDGWTR